MSVEREVAEVDRVVGAWHDFTTAKAKTIPSDLASDFREQFPDFSMRGFTAALKKLLAQDRNHAESMQPMGGYFRALGVTEGAPQPQLSPLIRIFMRIVKGQVELMLRMAVLFVDPSERDDARYGAIAAHGWRFESADIPGAGMGDGSGNGFHHYPHVQPINAWEKHGKGLFPPEWDEALPGSEALIAPDWNETRPAIPLRCSKPAGVVIAAMTALYGSNMTHVILEAAARDELERELQEVTGRV